MSTIKYSLGKNHLRKINICESPSESGVLTIMSRNGVVNTKIGSIIIQLNSNQIFDNQQIQLAGDEMITRKNKYE